MNTCKHCKKPLSEVIDVETFETLYVWNPETNKYEQYGQPKGVDSRQECANCDRQLTPEDQEFWRQHSKYGRLE